MSGIPILIASVLVLAASIWAWLKNRRISAPQLPQPMRALWRWRWALGVVVAICSLFMRYSVEGEEGRVMLYGVPIVAYALDAKGRDYIGPFTAPTVGFNLLFWGMLPQLVAWLMVRLARVERHDT